MQIRLRILLMFLEWIFGDNNKYRCSDAWYEVFAKPTASSVLGIGSNPHSFQFLFERQLLFISSFFSCEELPIWNTPASPASLPFPPPSPSRVNAQDVPWRQGDGVRWAAGGGDALVRLGPDPRLRRNVRGEPLS